MSRTLTLESIDGRRAGVSLVLALAVALVSACGGSDGGGNGGPTQPQPGISFSEDGSPAANTVFLTDAFSASAGTLILEVRANQMDHVRGFAFDIEYPSNLLTFQEAAKGDFLGPGGVVELLANEREPGTIVIGITRFGDNRTVVSGSGLVMTLTFNAVTSGSGAIGFESEQAFREFSTLTAADWLGGTVTVNL